MLTVSAGFTSPSGNQLLLALALLGYSSIQSRRRAPDAAAERTRLHGAPARSCTGGAHVTPKRQRDRSPTPMTCGASSLGAALYATGLGKGTTQRIYKPTENETRASLNSLLYHYNHHHHHLQHHSTLSSTTTTTTTTTSNITTMSDTGRQSIASKAGAALKPDSEKSTTEHIGDKFKGNADSVGSSVEPASQKSYTQMASDAISGNSNGGTEPSMGERLKNAVGMGENK